MVASGTMLTRLAAVAMMRAPAAPPGTSAALAVAAPPAPITGSTPTATAATGTGATRMVAAGTTPTAARPGMNASPAGATPPAGPTRTATAATGTTATRMAVAGMMRALAPPHGMSAAPAGEIVCKSLISVTWSTSYILAFSFPSFPQRFMITRSE